MLTSAMARPLATRILRVWAGRVMGYPPPGRTAPPVPTAPPRGFRGFARAGATVLGHPMPATPQEFEDPPPPPPRLGCGELRLAILAAAALVGCSSQSGETFVPITSDQPAVLLSAWIASDGTAYLAGGVPGGGDGLLLRWDGHGIATIPTP